MDKKQFVEKIGNPVKFTSQERGWLRAVQAKYPYSSVINVLTLMADRVFHFDTPEERRVAMLSMCDGNALGPMLDKAVATVEEPTFDVLSEINTFQEVSFKTAPKSVILSNFLQVGPYEETKKAQTEPVATNLNDKKSLQANSSLGTETLAVILEQQGRYDKALAIYKNLLANNPEKSSIFAPRIQRLTTILSSK